MGLSQSRKRNHRGQRSIYALEKDIVYTSAYYDVIEKELIARWCGDLKFFEDGEVLKSRFYYPLRLIA